MKRFANNENITNDLTRASWSNSSNASNSLSNRLLNDKLKENIFIQSKLPQKPISEEVTRIPSNNTFTADRNEMNRFNNMTQDMLDKDKEIHELKNKLSITSIDIDKLKNDVKKGNTYKLENDILKDKLNEQYKEHKKLLEYQSKFKELEILKQRDEETIESLKTIIRKLMKPEYEEQEKKYKNDKLKEILLKKNQDYNEDQIDNLFEEMEITEDINITKDLLITIIEYLDDN
jgi:hypothetical protein|tara:strand:- start:24 stop:722 length:699 start_codon:yes stop_codon:yes gene_type:complete